MNKIPVILDGDPGHDDAIAWVFAKAEPVLDIRAVCSVAGNQTIEKTTWNARRICALLGIDAPFAKGAVRPLIVDPVTAGNWHGESGLDGPAMPMPDHDMEDEPAADLMAKVIKEAAAAGEKMTIISTGPLTNVAQLLIRYPECVPLIRQISIMGGGLTHGNWKPAAEFNIYEDPEAAWIVFHSGIHVIMAGLDVTEHAVIKPEDFPRIRAVSNQVALVTAGWLEFFCQHAMDIGYEGAPVHDPCAVLALTHPELFQMQDIHVDIELTGEYTRGATVADLRNGSTAEKNATCLMGIDGERYVDQLIEDLRAYDGREVECVPDHLASGVEDVCVASQLNTGVTDMKHGRPVHEDRDDDPHAIPHIWIDTDTGTDDAIALMCAARLHAMNVLRLEGVSSVCGNVEEEKTFRNARNVLYLAGAEDIPVYPGAQRPLMKDLETAASVHGKDGLGEAVLEDSPAPKQEVKAWDAIYQKAVSLGKELELILIGPETNAAIAFEKYPDLKDHLKRILVMGGSEAGGNITPAAEFNIFTDPQAAQTVFRSGVQIIMCGLDVTMKAGLTGEEFDSIAALPSRGGQLFAKCETNARRYYEETGEPLFAIHDVCPVLYTVYPDIFYGEEAGVYVETQGFLTFGKTVSDRITDTKFGIHNAVIVLDANRSAFVRIVSQLLAAY